MNEQTQNDSKRINTNEFNITLGRIHHDNSHFNYLESRHTMAVLPIVIDTQDLQTNNKEYVLVNKIATKNEKTSQYTMDWIDVKCKPSVKNTQMH